MKQAVYIQSIAVLAPGIENWDQLQNILHGNCEHTLAPVNKLVPDILPANERRRTTQFIKLALHVAEQACKYKPRAKQYASVFAASDGDFEILDRNTHALSLPGHPVSPTNFHNSVHNAASGYWAIAAQAQTFSTSLSAGTGTFSAGMFEAMTFSVVESQPVICIAFEYPPVKSILCSLRPVQHPFAVAMVMQPERDADSIAALRLTSNKPDEQSRMQQPTLEALRCDNPAARALPLLNCIAQHRTASCCLPAVNNTLVEFEVTPCQ